MYKNIIEEEVPSHSSQTPAQNSHLESQPSSDTLHSDLEVPSHMHPRSESASQSSSDDVSVFGNSSKHLAIRREADELYRQSAERMKMEVL